MKKFVSILLIIALALSLVACGGGETTPENNGGEETAKRRIAYIVGNLGDKSFNDSGEVGMNTLRAEGYDVKTLEVGQQADKYSDFIYDAIDNGYNLILASSTYYDAMKPIAEEYPEIEWVLFDDNKSPEDLPDNMTCIFYAQNEGSYMVGMMAAAMTKSGIVSCNLGIMNPVLGDFVAGYVNGVKDWNEANGTDVKVIVSEVGSWTDPAKMKSMCLEQNRNLGADVFYQVAGGSGDGVMEACLENGTWAIGVDSDQYASYKDSENPEKADTILTSMLKEVGNSLIEIVHQIEAGEDVWDKTITLGLAENSVGYVDNDFFKENVPEDVRTAMAEAAEKIKSGELKVQSYYDFASEAEYNEYVASVAP